MSIKQALRQRLLRSAMASGSAIVTLVSGASASLVDVIVEHKTTVQPVGGQFLFVWNLWAAFNNPGDRLIGVRQAEIITFGLGSIYQHPLGGDTAPDSSRFAIDPMLQYDSFVTIGLKSVRPGVTDSTALEPASAFTGPGGTTGFMGGWYNTDPDGQQGVPMPVFPGPWLFVLMAQLTFMSAGPLPTGGIVGGMIAEWTAAGAPGSTFTPFDFSTFPPAPGALPLLMIAALAGRRRRP